MPQFPTDVAPDSLETILTIYSTGPFGTARVNLSILHKSFRTFNKLFKVITFFSGPNKVRNAYI